MAIRIEQYIEFEEEGLAIEKNRKKVAEMNLNRYLVKQYVWSRDRGLDLIDLADEFEYSDVENILAELDKLGITELTMSFVAYSMLGKAMEFVNRGWVVAEIVKVESHNRWSSSQGDDMIPALRLVKVNA